MMLWSLPHDDVISSTASFRRASRSLSTPWIMTSGISITRIRAPTPKSFSIVRWRFLKNGCDFGSGGGASAIGAERLLEIELSKQQQYAGPIEACEESWPE